MRSPIRSLPLAFVAALLCVILFACAGGGFSSTLVSAASVSAGAVKEASPASAATLPVYRAVMYDRRASQRNVLERGTRSVLLRGAVTLYDAAAPATTYRKKTVYVPADAKLTVDTVSSLVGRGGAGAKGLVVELSPANEEALAAFLQSTAVDAAVYLADPASPAAATVRATLRAGAGSTVLTVGKSLRDAVTTANHSVAAHLLTSRFAGRASPTMSLPHGRRDNTPQLLISAHWDTIGVAPAAPTTGGASGAVAAVELWRRLIASAEVASAPVPYGATLLLGSTARLNYASSARWLGERKDAEIDRFRLALSLDELLPDTAADADAPLYLHLQDSFAKRADGKALVELAKAAAARRGVALAVHSTKTNYQESDLRFEHEIFASKQMPAVTLSARRTHTLEQILRNGRPTVNAAAAALLKRRVDFVEDLVRSLMEPATDAAAGSEAQAKAPRPEGVVAWPGSASFLQGLLMEAAAANRSLLSRDGGRHYARAVERHVRSVGGGVLTKMVASSAGLQTQRFELSSAVLYAPYEDTLRVYVSASIVTEVVLFAAAALVVLAFGYSEVGLVGLKRLVWPDFGLDKKQKGDA